jgi:hypothetical protein
MGYTSIGLSYLYPTPVTQYPNGTEGETLLRQFLVGVLHLSLYCSSAHIDGTSPAAMGVTCGVRVASYDLPFVL